MIKRKLSSNMEDYIEAIGLLKKEKGVARVRDIGRILKVKNPSVTFAINILSKNGLVIHERYGYVDLTREGEKLAQDVHIRHNMLIKFFSKILKVDSNIAKKDACKMEHFLSPQTFERLTKFIEFVETHPEDGRPDWLKSFDYYFKAGKSPKFKIRRIK